MPTSLMPKGVEHSKQEAENAVKYAHAHLCDAERR